MSDTAVCVRITGQYARLSRGRIVAKHLDSQEWGERGDGCVTLDRAGKWMVSQTDGYARKETAYVTVGADGSVTGLGSRMRLA